MPDNFFNKIGYSNSMVVSIFFALLVSIIYFPSLNAPFYLDDNDIILNEKYIQFDSLGINNIINTENVSINKNRIVSYISLGLSYYFSKYDPKGYRYFNIILHILTSILLFELIRITLTILYPGRPVDEKLFIALSATLLWLAHPIQTQAVTYVVQRMTLLASFFYLLSTLLYVKGRLSTNTRTRILFIGGCVLSGFLAFGSKEIAATLPLFILLYEWFIIQDLKMSWLAKNKYFLLGILLLFIGIAFLYTKGDPLRTIEHGFIQRDFTLTERLMTQPRVIMFYLSLLIFPYPGRLSLEHDFTLSTSLLSPPSTLLSILFITACIVAAFLSAKKYRLFAFGILWFFGNLAIESTFIPLEMVFEHRLYLPTALLFTAIPTLLLRAFPGKQPAVAIAIILAAVLSLWSYQRNIIWADPLLFNRNNVLHAPNSYRAHNDYGRELINNGNFQEGYAHFRESIRLNPGYFQAHYNYGLNLTKQGYVDLGIYHLTKATEIRPHSDDAHNNLGIAYGKKGNFQDALKHFDKALEVNPQNIQAMENRTMVLNFLRNTAVP